MENYQQENKVQQINHTILLLDGINVKQKQQVKEKMGQKKISKSTIFGIVIGVFAMLLVAFYGMILEDAAKSKNYVCQMPWTGQYEVWTNGGMQLQMFGNVQEYSKTSQREG